MATIDGAGGSRKRLTTYGKAARKRVPETMDIERFNTHEGGKKEEEWTVNRQTAESTSLHQPLPIEKTAIDRHPSQSMPPIPVDMFDVPSSDDERTSTPGKRRKISHQTQSPRQKQAIAIVRESGLQRHGPSKKSSSIPARLPHELEAEEGRSPGLIQKVIRPAKPSSRLQSDFGSSIMLHKASRGQSATTNSLPLRDPSALQSGALETRNRLDRTPSPGRLAINYQSERNKSRAVPRVPTSVRHDSPTTSATSAAILQPSLTPSTPPMQGDVRRKTTRSVTPTVFTPRGQKMWDGLLGDEFVESMTDTRPSAVYSQNSHEKRADAQLSRPVPRRRLIDSLIDQSQKSRPYLQNSSDSEPEEEEVMDANKPGATIYGETSSSASQLSTSIDDNMGKAFPPVVIGSASQNSQTAGPKVTYSRQRSMLAEQEMSEKMAFDTPLGDSFQGERRHKRRGSIPILAPLRSFQESEDVDDGQTGISIRTIHELRQAGAQNRFLDEVEDLLDRVGTPSHQISMRRSGLMDLLGKMTEKEFNVKFLSNGLDQRLFLHLGQEEDILCGFMMISLLILVLNCGITPIAISQLRRQGITRLLIRLLDFSQPITVFARDRKANMSKSAQAVLLQQHEKLLKLDLWEDRRPELISPRIAALRCLEMMVRRSREAGNTAELISKELTSKLFGILKQYLGSDSGLSESPAIEFQLALSALESHSLKATTNLNEHLPVMREILESVLRSPNEVSNVIQLLTLRLTLNVTNNDATTSDIFATPEVMRSIGRAVVSGFTLLAKFLVEDERVSLVDHVVLMLGVMMNFAEWSATARQAFVGLHGSNSDPLDDMATIFSDNFEKISEADSVEDSQRNVAFGYLAVVLGYFSLVPVLEGRIRARLKTLQPLILSIEEFISHHKKVDEILKDEIDGYNPHTGLTDRLERMLDGLKGLKM